MGRGGCECVEDVRTPRGLGTEYSVHHFFSVWPFRLFTLKSKLIEYQEHYCFSNELRPDERVSISYGGLCEGFDLMPKAQRSLANPTKHSGGQVSTLQALSAIAFKLEGCGHWKCRDSESPKDYTGSARD